MNDLLNTYTIDGLRETINQLTPSVNRPEVKGYAYCHTFVGMNWSCILLQVLENVTFRPLTRWFKAAVPSDVRIGVERAKNCSFPVFLNVQ